MSSTCKLSAYTGEIFEDPTLYRSIVGGLQYLSFTRPDIAFSVNRGCPFMHKPLLPHWKVVKCILQYLKQTISHGLLITQKFHMNLSVYSDSDWARDQDDRRSTSAYCIFLGNTLISWSSRKQQTVARSSNEAEYKALANAIAELQWIKQLLSDLGFPLTQNPILWCHNIGATYLSSNPVYHARTKHIEIDFHFVCDRVASKELTVRLISSKDQKADLFTKPLSHTRFSTLRANLNVHILPLRLRGSIEDSVIGKESTSSSTNQDTQDQSKFESFE
jgi:hypothetical protein